jgi:probable RNA-binding protein EIF1AD
MSGFGRKSSYRKSLTQAYENDFPEPKSNELIVRVKSSRGSNLFEIDLPNKNISNTSETQTNVELALLPKKFLKVIWVKRNDFVIVEQISDSKVKYEINHILNKDQINHLKRSDLWPTEFMENEVKTGYDEDIIPSSDYRYETAYDEEDIMTGSGAEFEDDKLKMNGLLDSNEKEINNKMDDNS